MRNFYKIKESWSRGTVFDFTPERFKMYLILPAVFRFRVSAKKGESAESRKLSNIPPGAKGKQ
jgi:hypothetical protein